MSSNNLPTLSLMEHSHNNSGHPMDHLHNNNNAHPMNHLHNNNVHPMDHLHNNNNNVHSMDHIHNNNISNNVHPMKAQHHRLTGQPDVKAMLDPARSWVETYLDSGPNSLPPSRGPCSLAHSLVSNITAGGATLDMWNSSLLDEACSSIDLSLLDGCHGTSTRAQHIRDAMYGTDSDRCKNADTAPPSSGSFVSRLGRPSHQLKQAVVDLVKYKDDADLTGQAIPELIKFLTDEDPVVVAHAVSMVYKLAKREASRCVIEKNDGVLNGVISAISRATNEELASTNLSKHGVYVMHATSARKEGTDVLLSNKMTIKVLVRLMKCPFEMVVFHAVSALHNLLLHQPRVSKQLAIGAGALPSLVALLNRKNVKFLAVVSDSLQILAFGNQQAKESILETHGTREIVNILRQCSYEKLRWTCSRLLKVLSVCPKNKRFLVDADAINVFCQLLQAPDSTERTTHNALYTLRNLSDQAVKLDGLENLLRMLIEMLTSADRVRVACAAGILSNLTCNNPRNKITVVQHNGVEALIRTLIQASQEDVIESTVCTLRHVTCRHKLATEAQDSVRLCFGLPAIVRLLNSSQVSWALIKTTVGLIRNLATCPSNVGPLRESGCLNRLMGVLRAAVSSSKTAPHPPKHPLATPGYEDMRNGSEKRTMHGSNAGDSVSISSIATNTTAASVNSSCIMNRRMESVVESCVASLHALAKDVSCRKALHEISGAYTLIAELINSNSTPYSILRSVFGILNELSLDPNGLSFATSLFDRLLEMSTCEEPVVAAFATNILRRATNAHNNSKVTTNTNTMVPSSGAATGNDTLCRKKRNTNVAGSSL